MTTSAIDMEKFEQQVDAYKKDQPNYESFAKLLSTVLSRALKNLGIMGIVQSRAKGIPNFAEKMIRKREKYSDAVNQFTDLCGARIIVDYPDEIEPVCEFIKRHFELHEAEDLLERLSVAEFGYRSVHFIVSLKPGALDDILHEKKDGDIIKSLKPLYERRTLPSGPKFKAEIQVRTLLQHAWATFYHDRLYKGSFDPPTKWKRDANRIAATLEEADDAIARTVRGVDNYKTYQGAYMSREEREAEFHKLEAVFRHDDANMRLAHQIAGLQLSLDDFEGAEKTLQPFVAKWKVSDKGTATETAWEVIQYPTTGKNRNPDEMEKANLILESIKDPEMARVLLDYGWAKWKQSDAGGRGYIGWAITLDKMNVDARVALARTYEGRKALECFKAAFETDPSDPRALNGFVRAKIVEGKSLDFLSIISPSLEEGIKTCRERANVGVYLPHAYYDMGLFALLLGRPYESLSAYCKAIQKEPESNKIDEVLGQITALQEKAGEQKGIQFEWARRLLVLAKIVKSLQNSNNGEKDGVKSIIETAKDEFEKACIFPWEMPEIERPVVIVAGGCDISVEDKIQEYRTLFEKVFENFHGTVFSGGTTAGVSKLVGDIPPSSDKPIKKLAAFPQFIPSWTTKHEDYDFYYTGGVGFSALEPLQNWIYLLASGVHPADVKLLGINGGKIAAFEFRLAAALGAKAGIIADSGRAANEIFEDPDWSDVHGLSGLLKLPNDIHTVKVFVQGSTSFGTLSDDRETIARSVHDKDRKDREKRYAGQDPAVAAWEDLPDDFRYSLFHQIDYYEEELRDGGFKIQKVEGRSVVILDFSQEDMKEKVELMAQIEHGRWNAERLMRGWTVTTGKKDVERKKSPYIVTWAELPDDVKEWDRKFIRGIPERLAEVGYEVVPQ